jgi:hypothetical protein
MKCIKTINLLETGSHIKVGHRLKVFENRMLRGTDLKGGKHYCSWTKLCNAEVYSLH